MNFLKKRINTTLKKVPYTQSVFLIRMGLLFDDKPKGAFYVLLTIIFIFDNQVLLAF